MKLNANDPAGAIVSLTAFSEIRIVLNFSFNGLYPAYIRGLAYLQLGEGRLAAAEFQKLVDSQGFGGNRRDWGASTFADGQGAENDGRRSLRRKWYEDFPGSLEGRPIRCSHLSQAKASTPNSENELH